MMVIIVMISIVIACRIMMGVFISVDIIMLSPLPCLLSSLLLSLLSLLFH